MLHGTTHVPFPRHMFREKTVRDNRGIGRFVFATTVANEKTTCSGDNLKIIKLQCRDNGTNRSFRHVPRTADEIITK